MKYTNKADLPEGIVKAIIEDEYSIGDADYSQSKLAVPPQMARLMSIYSDDISIDVSDEIWKLLGKAVHYILEKANRPKLNKHAIITNSLRFLFVKDKDDFEYRIDDEYNNDIASKLKKILTSSDQTTSSLRYQIIQELGRLFNGYKFGEDEEDVKIFLEKRLYLQVGDIRLSGQIDFYHILNEKIEDYKVTSVWKILKKNLKDWEFQGNVYKLILENNGYAVKSIQINAILKDWKEYEFVQKKEEGYPPLPVHKIEIKIWKPLDVLKEIIRRIEDHEAVRSIINVEELYKLRPCTNDEKWHGEDKFAVMKHGGKKASAVFNTMPEAEEYMLEKTDGTMFIQIRPGEDKRCEDYCLVKQYCAQYKAEHGKLNIGGTDGTGTLLLPTTDEILNKLKPSSIVKQAFTPTDIPTETIGNETYPLPLPEENQSKKETITPEQQKISQNEPDTKNINTEKFDLSSFLKDFKK
jgi:hypothetical protein